MFPIKIDTKTKPEEFPDDAQGILNAAWEKECRDCEDKEKRRLKGLLYRTEDEECRFIERISYRFARVWIWTSPFTLWNEKEGWHPAIGYYIQTYNDAILEMNEKIAK